MLGRPLGDLLGPPRPCHKVRLFFSSPLVWSKVDFTHSEALSRAISVFKIFEFFREFFFVARSLLAKTSAGEILLGHSLSPKLRVQERELLLGGLFFCQGNRHTKKLAHKVFRAFALWRSRVNLAQKTLCAPRILPFFPQKSAHKESAHKVLFRPLGRENNCREKLCVPVLAQETPRKRHLNWRLSYLGCAVQAPI